MREPTSADTPPLALPHGAFAGSRRIQPLARTASVLARVVALPDGADGLVRLRAVAPPHDALWLDLGALTRPWLHLASLGHDPAARAQFCVDAAAALLETEVPILVEASGAPATRPAGLFALHGRTPSGGRAGRVGFVRHAGDWARHVRKHALSDEALAGLLVAVPEGQPVGRAVVKAAARYARRHRAAQGELPAPALWPLLECYATLSVVALEQLPVSEVLHVAREPDRAEGALGLWDALARLDPRGNRCRPGDEMLLVTRTTGRGELTTVARGPGGLDAALSWRTTYGDAPGAAGDRLAAHARRLARSADHAVVRWSSAQGPLSEDS